VSQPVSAHRSERSLATRHAFRLPARVSRPASLLLACLLGAVCSCNGGGGGGGDPAAATQTFALTWADFDYASVIPRPKSAARVNAGLPAAIDGYDIAVSALAGPAYVAAVDFRDYLANDIGWALDPEIEVFPAAAAAHIVIGKRSDAHPDNPIATLLTDRGLAARYQQFIDDGDTEWYILSVHSGGPVLVCSEDDAGLFYGVQTLKQLLTRSNFGNYGVRQFDIADWPDLAWRGQHSLSVDGPGDSLGFTVQEPATMDAAAAIIRFVARHKINFVQISFANNILLSPTIAATAKANVYDVAADLYVSVIHAFLNVHFDARRRDFWEPGIAYDTAEGGGAYDEPFTFNGSLSYATPDLPLSGWLDNSGFEDDVDDDDVPDHWNLGAGWAYEEGTGEAYPHDGGQDCISFHYIDPSYYYYERCQSDWVTVNPAGSGLYPAVDDTYVLRVAAKLSYSPADAADPTPQLFIHVMQQRSNAGEWTDAVQTVLPTFSLTDQWQKQLNSFRLEEGIGRFRLEMLVISRQTTDKKIVIDYIDMHRLNSALLHCVRSGDTWPYDIKVANVAGVPYTEGTDYVVIDAVGNELREYFFPEKSITLSTCAPPVNEELTNAFRIRHGGGGSTIGVDETVYVSYSFGQWVTSSYQNQRYCPSDPTARARINDVMSESIYYFSPDYVSIYYDEMYMGCDCPRCRARTDGVDENWEFVSDDIAGHMETCLNPGALLPGAQPVDKVFYFCDMLHPWHNGEVKPGEGYDCSWEPGDFYRWRTRGPLGNIAWVDGLGQPQGAPKDLADRGYADDIVCLIWNYGVKDVYHVPDDRTAGTFSEAPSYFASMDYDWIGATGESGANIRQWSWIAGPDQPAPGLGLLGTQFFGFSQEASLLVADYAWTIERCPNPGFEIDGIAAAVEDGVPDGWTPGADWAWVYGRNPGQHVMGNASTMGMRLWSIGFTGDTGTLRSDRVPWEPDEGGMLQVWAYINQTTDCTATIWVREYDALDALVAEHARDIDGPYNGWYLYARDFVTSATTTGVRVEIEANAPGLGTVDLWVDDLSLRPWYK